MRFFSLSGLYIRMQAFFKSNKRVIEPDYPLVVLDCLNQRGFLVSRFSQVIKEVLCNFCIQVNTIKSTDIVFVCWV